MHLFLHMRINLVAIYVVGGTQQLGILICVLRDWQMITELLGARNKLK